MAISTEDVDAAFRRGCANGVFIFMRCRACAHAQLAAFRTCTACGASDLAEEVAGHGGILASYTVVHRAPTEHFKLRTPYVLALVDLDSGPRAMMTIAGGHSGLRIGARIRWAVSDTGPAGEPLPQAFLDEAAS